MIINGYEVSFWSDKNALIVMMTAQLYEYTKKYLIVTLGGRLDGM